MVTILIETARLINMKKFRLFLLLLIYFLPAQARAEIDYSGYYDALYAGKYQKSVEIALGIIEPANNKDAESVARALNFAFLVADYALITFDFPNYERIQKMIERYRESNLLSRRSKMVLAILSNILIVSDPRLSISFRRKVLSGMETWNLPQFLIKENEIRVLLLIAKFEVETQNFTDAEKYLLNALAVAAGHGNIMASTLYDALMMLARIYSNTSRQRNIAAIAGALNTLEESTLLAPNDPKLIVNLAHALDISITVGNIRGAKQIISTLEMRLNKGVFVPPYARHLLLYSKSIIASVEANLDYFENIRTDVGRYFGDERLYDNKAFDPLRIAEFYGRLNAFGKLNKDELISLKKLQFSKDTEIFRDLAIFVSNGSASDEWLIDQLAELKKKFNALNMSAISDYQYEKSGNIFRWQILTLVLRSLRERYDGNLPSKLSAALFDLLIEAETSKVDFQYKVNHQAKKFRNRTSSYLANVYFKSVEEKNLLVARLIELSLEQVFAFAKRDFVYKAVKKNDIDLRFKLIRKSIDRIYSHLNDEEGFSNQLIFSPTNLTLDKVKERLSSSEDLLFYRMVGDEVDGEFVTCIISHNKHQCRLSKINRSRFSQAIDRLYLAASRPPSKGEAFPKVAAEYIYSSLLFGYRPSANRTLYVKPQTGHFKIPFRALRSIDWSPDEYLGLKTPVVFLASFFATEKRRKRSDFAKKYFAVGNPRYQIDTTDEVMSTGLFTIRSAAMADQLAELDALPDTAREISTVTKSLNHAEYEVLLGKQATELNVRLANINRFQVLHFATHGLVSGEFEGLKRPSLAFSSPEGEVVSELEDGLLSSDEIAELQISAKLVILSACQTVTDYGQPNNAGFDGLTSAFLTAGAQAVLATQWKIESVSAATAISSMIDLVLRKSNDPAKAMLRASILMSGQVDYNHPYYWAPYVLVKGLRSPQQFSKAKPGSFVLGEIIKERSTGKTREATDVIESQGRVFFTVQDLPFGKMRSKQHFGEFVEGQIRLKESPYGSLKIVSNTKGKLIFRAGRTEKSGSVTALLGTYDFDRNHYNILYEMGGPKHSISIFQRILRIKNRFLIQAIIYKDKNGNELWSGYIHLDNEFREIGRVERNLEHLGQVVPWWPVQIITDGQNIYRSTTVRSDENNQKYSLKSGYYDCFTSYDVHLEHFNFKNMNFSSSALHKGYKAIGGIKTGTGQKILLEEACGKGRYHTLQPSHASPKFLIDTPLRILWGHEFVSKAGKEYIFLNTKLRVSNLHRFGLPSKYLTGDELFSKSIKVGIRDMYVPTVLKKIRDTYQIVWAERSRLTAFYNQAFNIGKSRCGIFSMKRRLDFILEEFPC